METLKQTLRFPVTFSDKLKKQNKLFRTKQHAHLCKCDNCKINKYCLMKNKSMAKVDRKCFKQSYF